MGADIHVVLEKKFGEKWIGVEECRSRMVYLDGTLNKPKYLFCNASLRNYDLFAALAGVRGEGPEPKGLPEDASELALHVLEDDTDLHSHSWCMMDEYIQLLIANHFEPAKILLLDHPATNDPYQYFFNMSTPEEGEEYRVVFAFDN